MKIKPIVSIVKCEDYDAGRVGDAVAEALRLAELDSSFNSGQNVLLKPNLLSARTPDEAVTTHPALVTALGKITLERGCRVAVGDSPPFNGETQARYDRLCEVTGIRAVADELSIPLLRFEEDVVRAANPEGRFYRSFEVARAALESDVIINIPKLKTHGLTAYTGAVKNLFGCIPGIRKGLFHVQSAEQRETFAQMLVDLLGVFKPAINVMDAVVALEGEGPNSGNPRHVGLIIASADPVALDAVACAIIGIDPLSIHTTRLAHEQGLGCGDLSSIDVRGESIESVRVSGFKQSSGHNDWARIPTPVRRLLRNQLVASPQVRSGECVGCGDCARACPVKAITPGKPVTIDLTRCIRCYCCHEVCNPSAINLKVGMVGRIVSALLRKK
ncbi:MAG: DUF362 domain-containing protein [Armatimonadota bacterium]|nr:DUF362 domain-containing protein [bacterium]